MTTAYRRVECGHYKRLDIWHDSTLPDKTGKAVRCHEEVWSDEDGEMLTGPLIDCPGFTYVPWPELEEALRTIADGNLNQDEAMDTAVAALTRPGSEVLEPFRRNLRSEG